MVSDQPQWHTRDRTAHQGGRSPAAADREHPWPSHHGVLMPEARDVARGDVALDEDVLRRVLAGLQRL